MSKTPFTALKAGVLAAIMAISAASANANDADTGYVDDYEVAPTSYVQSQISGDCRLEVEVGGDHHIADRESCKAALDRMKDELDVIGGDSVEKEYLNKFIQEYNF